MRRQSSPLSRRKNAAALEAPLAAAERVYTSAVAVYEATLGLARIGNMPVGEALSFCEDFLRRTGAENVPIDRTIGLGAIEAFARFGRPHHPARLNMGDRFAYACAKSLGVPLLFKGDDFPQTDIALV
jgi:ribonuclease VapC